MKMKLYKFVDWPSSEYLPHSNSDECKSVSHFNWFARYNAPQDRKIGLKSELKSHQNESL